MFANNFTANLNDDTNDDRADSGPVIGVTVSAGILLAIVFVLCIVVCYMKWSHSKRKVTKSGSDIDMTSNPSYDINKEIKKQDYQMYDYATPEKSVYLQDNKQDTIKLEANPSYGRIQECEVSFYDSVNAAVGSENDVAIQLNPSYCSNLKKTSDDHDGYVKGDQDYLHSAKGTDYLEIIGPDTKGESPAVATDIVNVAIDPNPSYESMSGGVKLQDNPSYCKVKLT